MKDYEACGEVGLNMQDAGIREKQKQQNILNEKLEMVTKGAAVEINKETQGSMSLRQTEQR